MKTLKVLSVLLLVLCFGLSAAVKDGGNGVSVVSSSGEETVLKFTVRSYQLENVVGDGGIGVTLSAPGMGKMLIKGAPGLLKLSASVIIPDQAKMKVEIVDSVFTDITNVNLLPSKGNLLRTVDPDKIPFEYGPSYKANKFYPGKNVELQRPHIIRDFRGQTITVYPFVYNPVSQTLRVYSDITVKVSPAGGNGVNPLVRKGKLNNVSRSFRDVYSEHFVNYSVSRAYTALPDDIGNMLIICYNGFMSDMSDFVSWKESIGYNVDLVDYSTIGSSTALKTYVANYYNTNGLTYLLLVGDHAQVPTSSTSAGDSDNNYGYIVGSDHYLDIFVGRFSAETSTHVQTQVERTIHYERDVLSTDSFFRNAVGMGSSEGPGQDGEYDYQHINNILADLTGYGYSTYECHESNGSPTLMSSLINAGTGTIFYCGHGSVTQWYTSTWQYTSSHVDALVNEYELPFVVSVACVVGDFKNYTCFCETWLRATNNGSPTGAVVHCGSTINQSWVPPMDAEDEMADLLVSGNMRTFGGIFVNGLFEMIDINGSGGEDMADTWTCFGDPSVQLRTPGTPDGPGSGNLTPRAQFTYSANLLQVTFTDTSYDNDGSIASWLWNFGDGYTSTTQHPVHTYAASGNYTVTLTVTDNEGASDDDVQTIQVSDGTEPELFVQDISMSISRAGRNYTGSAVITVKDTDGNVVPNATVSATWSGVVSGNVSGVTGADGKVTFNSGRVKSTGPFIITVTNISHASIDYNASLNVETSDSITY